MQISLTFTICVLLSIVAVMPSSHLVANATNIKSDITSTNTTSNNSTTNSTTTHNEYNCPEDCQCLIPTHTAHKNFLHVKCSSIKGLKAEKRQQTTLPIHSIDLSFIALTRLSHALENLDQLASIDLSHNELHEFGHLGRNLKRLNLKHNRITSNKLTKLPLHLQMLNLQHNDITYLPLEFTRLSQLQTLELSHNEINCSCETLEVRNWLQERHVFMEHPVVCSYPAETKGKPWLQVKQSDVCENEKRGRSIDQDENELMLGDQPFDGSGENEEEEELGKDFLRIDTKPNISKAPTSDLDDVEGSGDLTVMNMPLQAAEAISSTTTTSTPELVTDADDEDGSGSGGGPLIIVPSIHHVIDDFEESNENENRNKDDDFDKKPVEEPTPNIFGDGMGIFDGDESNKPPVTEEEIKPVVHHVAGAGNEPKNDVVTDAPIDADDSEAENIQTASTAKDDSNAIYFLMGVIVLIVLGLILFVAIKRCKGASNRGYDPENPRQTELLDMDKKNLGKPVQRNGNEHIPLIGEKTKSDLAKPINGAGGAKKPYDSNDTQDGANNQQQQQPLLNGQNAATAPPNESDNNNENIPVINLPQTEQTPQQHEYYPITPRYPTPKSPRASKYAQHPPQNNEPTNNNAGEEGYTPVSPKTGRYSPVYSPETGRVKIKLTETPRPKTPMLITRSKSNAGEIIATPVHLGTVGGGGGVEATNAIPANGYMQH